jgi:phosphoglycerate dehydrogenase-like enzyme
MVQIGILEPTDFSPRALEILRAVGKVSCFQGGDRKSFLQDKEVVFVRLAQRVDVGFLQEASRLKVLVSPTTGVAHLDLKGIKAHGAIAMTLAGKTDFLREITASSEPCLGMILGVLRNYPHAILGPGKVHWDRDSVRGHDVKGLDIGLVGLGRIGQWLARVLTLMGARVRYCESSEINPDVATKAVRCNGIAPLIEQSTLVVLSASYVPETPPLLDAGLLDALKGKYLVNIARGELVDEPHLLRRISEGWFAGVALDVLKSEPRPIEDLEVIANLASQQNFMLTPHIGGATYESSFRTEEFIARQLAEYLSQGGITANCSVPI